MLGEGHLFAALWEGKGGSQAARHCVSSCYDVVSGFLAAGDEPSTALQKAFKAMDESFLASDLQDLVSTGHRGYRIDICRSREHYMYIRGSGNSCLQMRPTSTCFPAGHAAMADRWWLTTRCVLMLRLHVHVCLQVKASVGATGTMVLLDIKTNRCHVARLGKSIPFATASKGAT